MCLKGAVGPLRCFGDVEIDKRDDRGYTEENQADDEDHPRRKHGSGGDQGQTTRQRELEVPAGGHIERMQHLQP